MAERKPSHVEEARSTRPGVERLQAAMAALARGELGIRVAEGDGGELAVLERAFNGLASSIERRIARLEHAQQHVQEATSRFAKTLSATHQADQLIRVIVDAVLEETRASGAVFVGEDGDVVRAGDPDAGAERMEFVLETRTSRFGSLVVAGDGFTSDDQETAASLVVNASIALENVRLHRIVARQAQIDDLTGLANRRRCEQTLATEIARAERFASPLAFVFADLDEFKRVNDVHGHRTGDDVLRAFARVLSTSVRTMDLPARWGGEEFAVLVPGTDVEGGSRLAERIRAAFERATVLSPDGSLIRVTASFGVAAYPDAGDMEALIAAADAALYEAKRTGRNRVASAAAAIRSDF